MLTIIPTIDVEGTHGTRPFEQLVLGQIGADRDYGISLQSEIFGGFGISATFFVDVYEYTFWGEDKLRDACRGLISSGQDVQLHTHPGWRVDRRDPSWLQSLKRDRSFLSHDKDLMAKLTREEQSRVLERGIELLDAWTGSPPVAHRSGGYSINDETIEALRANGIRVDSSMNVTHKNSEITWSRNKIVEKKGIVELPVTVGRMTYENPIAVGRQKLATRVVKTDANTFGCSGLIRWVEDALSKNLSFMNLFMHSYSLIKSSYDYSRNVPNVRARRELEDFLKWAKTHPDVEFMSVSAFSKSYETCPGRFEGGDSVPNITISTRDALSYAIARTKHNIADQWRGFVRGS